MPRGSSPSGRRPRSHWSETPPRNAGTTSSTAGHGVHPPVVHGHALAARRAVAVGPDHPGTGNPRPEHQPPDLIVGQFHPRPSPLDDLISQFRRRFVLTDVRQNPLAKGPRHEQTGGLPFVAQHIAPEAQGEQQDNDSRERTVVHAISSFASWGSRFSGFGLSTFGSALLLDAVVVMATRNGKGSGVVFGQAAIQMIDLCPKTTPEPVFSLPLPYAAATRVP
jgi:hypothetical protein